MTRLLLFGDPEIDFADNALFFKHSAEVEESVENVEFAFAVTGISSARKRDVKILALDGVNPTKENIASGAYGLFRPLYLVTKGAPAGETKQFVDWLLSEKGQQVVSDQGTVNLAEGQSLRATFGFWQHPDLITNY
jgi:phosphate transport system substrate-binding protein